MDAAHHPTSLQTTIGLPARPAAPRIPAPRIPDYRLIKPIGRGAFGTVWLAEEPLAGVFRAIKVLHHDVADADHGSSGRLPGGFIDRELSGLHALQTRSQGHPHLIQILKTGVCPIATTAVPSKTGQPDRAANESPPPAHTRAVYYVMEI